MKRTIIFITIILVLIIAAPARDLLLKNGVLYTFDRGILKGFDLLILQGRIAAIGKNLPNKNKVAEIDLKGKHVIPGIIDSHNHIGISGGVNEVSENITPEVKMEYHINPDDTNIYYSLSGGVTMNHAMHGSANPIGGENFVFKLKWGKTIEEMMEKRTLRTLKMALGENPKRVSDRFPNSRMGVFYAIERAYNDALLYKKEWDTYRRKLNRTKKKDRYKLIPPKKNYRLEALLDTLAGKMVIRCHSYRAEETLGLIRLAKKIGFKVAAFEHIHQAYRIADELKANDIGISIFIDVWNYKVEASEFSPFGLRLLYEKGVEISINSDTTEIMRRLYMEAGKMRRYAGMNDLDALKTITLNPARMLGAAGFTGSLKKGYDADLAVFDGHPLSSMSKCMLTLIEGEIYFDRLKDKNAGLKSKKVEQRKNQKKPKNEAPKVAAQRINKSFAGVQGAVFQKSPLVAEGK
ncbi:MAG: amidohydrolase family protein [Candidatus Aminicenantes bacterium]|nr:amidohydrolase family protein [Candidatus Aminicenantes bacterium]